MRQGRTDTRTTKVYHLLRVIAASVGIVSAVEMSACRTATSDISIVGPDTYNISASASPVSGGSVEAKRIALSQANAFCAKSGKEAFVTTFKTSKNDAEVNFRCEDSAPPNLQQR